MAKRDGIKRISTKQWVAEQRLKTGARPLVGKVERACCDVSPARVVEHTDDAGELLGYVCAHCGAKKTQAEALRVWEAK